MLDLTCEITIGDYVFTEAHQVTIRTGRNILIGTANIKLPNVGSFIGDPTILDTSIKVNDPVEIKLGYDGENRTEFVGFVKEKRPNVPFEIICEDAMASLRTTFSKNYESVALSSLIKELVPDAYLHGVPEITLTDFRINHATRLQVLNEIKTTYPGVDVYFRNGRLYAGLPYQEPGFSKVVYHLQDNTIKNDLVFKDPGDLKIRVRAISYRSDNTWVEIPAGDPEGDVVTLHFGAMSESELLKQANEKVKQLKIKGFKGRVTTWGLPYAQHGDIAVWEDDFYPNRQQANFIDEVTVEWGAATGFRRHLIPGLKAQNNTI